MKLHWQIAGEEISIADWLGDDEYATYPEGSRNKQLLRCPSPAPHPWLVPGHRYLFKESRRTYPEQFWAEIVAARVGDLCGVEVPPAYAAWDESKQTAAALIEWFYGYVDGPVQRFISGGALMKGAIKDFDHEKGRQHNFGTIDSTSSILAKTLGLQPDWMLVWARMLTFDALIGNTDRHQENWGLLWQIDRTKTPNTSLLMAPAFDNGTSLGHEMLNGRIADFCGDEKRLRRYIERGHHHMRWHLSDARKAQHGQLLLQLVGKYPQSRPAMISVLQVSDEQLRDAILPLSGLALPVPFSEARAALMLHLLRARRDSLLSLLTAP
ncbi:MAG: HipA domain-containing protein [Pseudomonadota bacterium]